MKQLITSVLCLFFLLPIATPSVLAADSWPMPYRDSDNSNYSSATPTLPFTLNYSVANRYIKPVIDENILITARLSGTNRFLTAYNAVTGQTLWGYSLGKEIPSQPLIYNGHVLLGVSTSANVYSLDLKTGALIWKITVPGERLTRHAPVVIEDSLYIAGDKLHKITLAGNYVWTKSFDIESPLAISDHSLYLHIHGQELISYNVEAQMENWRYHTNTTTGTHPVIVDNTIYIGLYGRLAAINRITGEELWHYNTTSGRTKIGSIAANKDYVIIGTNGGDLIRLSPDGSLSWRIQYNPGDYQGNGWLSEFIISGTTLIGRYNQFNTLILDVTSGNIVEVTPLATTGVTPVALSEPHIYFTKDSNLFAYRSSNWKQPQTTIPSPAKKRPVIIVPGILESWPIFGTWRIDPIFGIFRGLLTALNDSGYVEGELVFPFAYDWHKPNEETAISLRQFIQETKQHTGAAKVDIVAHSMGGLVARHYIQGEGYQNDVHTLITIATPHHGASKAYLTWEAGEIGSTVIDTVAEKLITYETRKAGYVGRIVSYLHEKVPSLGELLPIYNYLKSGDTLLSYLPCNPLVYPCNPFLEHLDSTLALLKERVEHLNITAATSTATTLATVAIAPSPLRELWQHGMPLLYPKENGLRFSAGDTTVPLSSAQLEGSQEIELTTDHIGAVTQAIPAIIHTLTGNSVENPITPWLPPKKVLFLEWEGIGKVTILTQNNKPVRITQRPEHSVALAESTPLSSEIFFESEGERGIAILPHPDDRYFLELTDLQPTATIVTTVITDDISIEQIIYPTGDRVAIEANQPAASTPPPSPIMHREATIDVPPKPSTSTSTPLAPIPSIGASLTSSIAATSPGKNIVSTIATTTPSITPSPIPSVSSVLVGGIISKQSHRSSRDFYRLIIIIFISTFSLLCLFFYRLHRTDLPKD